MHPTKYISNPGSSSFITDAAGLAEQHIQYLPFGELFVSQRNTTFDSRYKFTAKELDNETNYTYFGARYYDSDISIWLSVDPLAENTPWASPYAYCINNPIRLIDPDGRDWFENEVTGEIIYQKDMRKKDTKALGENWSWMGKNNMFGESPDKLYNDFKGIKNNTDESVSFGFTSEDSKKFMSERGYEFRTKSEEVVEKVISPHYTEANGEIVSPHPPVVETLDVKSRTFTYVEKGLYSNCIESKKSKDRSYNKTPIQWEIFEVKRNYFYTPSKPNQNKDYSWEIYQGSQIIKNLLESIVK